MMVLVSLSLIALPIVIGLATVQLAFRLIDKLKDVVSRNA